MAAPDLKLVFINDTCIPEEDIHLSFQNPNLGSNDFDVSLGDGNKIVFENPDDLMSVPVTLAEIGKAGLSAKKLNGAVIYVSYGTALPSGKSAPSYAKGSTSYLTPFQPFEVTRMGSPGDQGDVTAINYFTAPMAIQSYCGGPDGELLQSVGYVQNVDEIANKLKALTHSNPEAVVTTHDGDLIRILGPSSYTPEHKNPYSSFIDYVKSVHHAKQITRIVNQNAFNTCDPTTQAKTNYNFILDLEARAEADGSLQVSGKILTTITTDQGSNPGPTFTHCTLELSAASANLYNNTIYDQVITDAVTFGGGWQDLSDYITSVGLSEQSAYSTTQNLAIGDITSGLLMGFINSPYIPDGETTALKDMTSEQWWKLDPVVAFSSIQPAQDRYNPYADVLYWASKNSVYSIPYSDRLGSGPLVNTVEYEGKTVDTWVITLGRPVCVSLS